MATTDTRAIATTQAAGAQTPQDAEIRQWAQVVEMTGVDLATIALIRQKQGKDPAPPIEMGMFLHACKQLGLDPLSNQAYWIRRAGKGALQVGIDGFRLIASRSGAYAGSEPAVFRGTQELKDGNRTLVVPSEAQVVVWRIVQGRKCAYTGQAFWDEFYPGDGPVGAMYRSKPRLMLAKDAEAQALRKGFAAELVGMPVRAVEIAEVEAEDVTTRPGARPAFNAADYDRLQGSEEDGTFFDQPAPTTPPPGRGEAPTSPRRPDDQAGEQRAYDEVFVEDPPTEAEKTAPRDPETGEVLDQAPDQRPIIAAWADNRKLVQRAQKLGLQGLPVLNNRSPDDVVAAANRTLLERITNFELDQKLMQGETV
jgi:phage recombination protein Bet